MSDESAKGRATEPHEVGPGLGSGQVERRLSAFLALDIKSYSVLISDDEARTHRRVGRDLAVVVRASHKHNGRVVHFAGDGLLAEFVNPGATLQSALDIQSAA